MRRKLSWPLKPLRDLHWADREHIPLPLLAVEEDPRSDLEHLFKVVEEILLEISAAEELLEDDAAADGAVVVKEEIQRRRELAYSAILAASMDITQVNVHEDQAVPPVVEQRKA